MITDLIPQREPIIMIDGATLLAEGAATTLRVRDENWFAADGCLLEAGLMEHMAQSAAAMSSLQADSDVPRPGFIGEVKDLHIARLPRVGELLQTTVRTLMALDAVLVIEAVTRVGGEQVAEGRIKVFLTN